MGAAVLVGDETALLVGVLVEGDVVGRDGSVAFGGWAGELTGGTRVGCGVECGVQDERNCCKVKAPAPAARRINKSLRVNLVIKIPSVKSTTNWF
jgi:hypothetical protein